MKEIYDAIITNYAKLAVVMIISFWTMIGIGVLKDSLAIMEMGFDIMFATFPALVIGAIAAWYADRKMSEMEETKEEP